MSTSPLPIESEFATAEQAEAYDRWFQEKVHASLDDPRPCVPHDEVMVKMQEIIEKKRRGHASDTVAR